MKIIDLAEYDYTIDDNLFYSIRYLDVLREEYNFTFKIIIDDDAKGNNPLLVFAEIDDIFGKRIISLPFCDYTEPLTKSDCDTLLILEFLKKTHPDFPITIKLHGKMDEAEDLGYKNVRNAVCHRVDLRSDIEGLWNNTNHAFRRGVNKAKKNGLRCEVNNTEDGIKIFHRLLTILRMKKFGILPQPITFYMCFLKHFINKGYGNVWFSYLNDKPIASVIVLNSGKGIYYKMGVSDTDYLDVRPNNLLFWEVMKHGNQMGFEFLDLGLSQLDYVGLIRFKDSLGGIQTSINYYQYIPSDYNIKHEQEIRKLLKNLTGLFLRPQMSIETIEEAGRILYKYFC